MNWHLIYAGRLPTINNHQVHRLARWRLMKAARRVFGELPEALRPVRRATVVIVRVLGPRQKDMDDDSLALLLAGLRDALKPSYIKDDSPRWARFHYRQDGSRRDVGPRIEVWISYEEEASYVDSV